MANEDWVGTSIAGLEPIKPPTIDRVYQTLPDGTQVDLLPTADPPFDSVIEIAKLASENICLRAELKALRHHLQSVKESREAAIEGIAFRDAEIKRLRTEAAELREALAETVKTLEPFANEASQWLDTAGDRKHPMIGLEKLDYGKAKFTVGDLRKANRLVSKHRKEVGT